MYPDFCLVAGDQLFNQIAKVRHMFGGGFPLPLMVRSRVSAGAGYGSQHSMDASGLFALYPGWRIVAPSTPLDYIGLVNSALRCNDPVLVVEHNDLYQTVGQVPIDDWDYCIPFGSARDRAAGRGLHGADLSLDGADLRRRRRTSGGSMPRSSICARWIRSGSIGKRSKPRFARPTAC